jgi:tyrosinase
MPRVRRNVWTLPQGDKTLEWYGKAVEALQQRPISDVTSWWSLAAIHGFVPDIWNGLGYFDQNSPLPPSGIRDPLWNQCQHMTWYFLPWHRGYLAAFERIVRDAIVKLGGPSDWALPYWNYTDSAQWHELPRAFANPTLPDGSRNFLRVPQRYGNAQVPNVQTPLVLDPRVVGVAKTLQERFFEGTAHGGSAGFGGVKTPFWHGNEIPQGTFGVLETQPHGGVHVMVGGGYLSQNPFDWGLMTNPDTAALDPIFWLHHSNIDRLWKVWLRQQRRPTDPTETFKNPADTDWLDGPRPRQFMMPDLGGQLVTYTARDMLDTTAPMLDYIYDDETVAVAPVQPLAARLQTLGAARAQALQIERSVAMSPPKPAELLGASEAVRLAGDTVEARVRLDSGQREKLMSALNVRALAAAPREPDRVYLNLENIKSPSDAALFYVYVNLPGNESPEQHPEHLAGTISMFGVSKASAAGSSVNASFDITSIVDKMQAQNALGQDLSVKLISAVPGARNEGISIGRISVYRQGY